MKHLSIGVCFYLNFDCILIQKLSGPRSLHILKDLFARFASSIIVLFFTKISKTITF